MKKMLLGAMTLILALVPVKAVTVLQDGFSYTGWNSGATPMNTSGWQLYTTNPSSNPSFLSTDGGTNTALSLNNRGVRYDFSSVGTITQDFTVNFKLQTDAASRNQYFLITSAPDVNGVVTGYGVNLSSAANYGTTGAMAINSVNIADSAITNGSSGTKIAGYSLTNDTLSIGSAPTTLSSFLDVTFTWNNTGLMTLSVNGSQLMSVTNTSYASFSRVYLFGNTNGYFDDLSVNTSAVPEPTALALLAVVVLPCLVWRRRLRLCKELLS